ncbi:Peroxisomal membrane protein PAS20 [Emydomyces testavorans]|uniref:Peroxisomal membrane protein PEX13 n=1 Tax=Emydomyces testavorans TaxID=2070801 RepID=A0AAF0DJ31_9EURO|nr:Peroxisomal membrane protein PAS20 [Emydomyces testavorans]
MASVSPPKPWERPGAAGEHPSPPIKLLQIPHNLPFSSLHRAYQARSGTAMATTPTVTPSSTASSSSKALRTQALTVPSATSQPPTLPSRANTLNSVVNQTVSNYSPYGASRLGTGPYGGYGYNSLPSPYPRLGGMYGGYGGMYGGYGAMYGGIQNGDPNSLTNSFNQSTQATFQMIESIVGAFGGLAQMLESTYMATHSSFFAMVSVAEQFGNLRNTLGSVLGIFTVLRWFRTLFARLTGRPLPADANSLSPSAFSAFLSKRGALPVLPNGAHAPPYPSKTPFFFFLAAVFGLPYLMTKLIRVLMRSQEAKARRQQEMVVASGQQAGLDPSKLDFCRALYDYTPDAQVAAGIDLTVKKGDIVAVLSKTDPRGNPSEWWRCRARDGSVGYLPGPYLQTIQRKPQQQSITTGGNASTSSCQINTLGSVVKEQRTTSLSSVGSVQEGDGRSAAVAKLSSPDIKCKLGETRPESLPKSTIYS